MVLVGCSPVLMALLAWPPAHGRVQREDLRPPLTALDLAPLGEERVGRDLHQNAELVPVLAGERVLVTSTLRLFALSADTGELLWTAGPPAGWDALDAPSRGVLFAGIDHEGLLVAPAAGARVAVAALQLPLSRKTTDDWQGIEIERALPERRLFAFELATGRELWNHAPPPDWDRATGAFERRMNVIGTPLVAGERVLVACTADESSIDYHVACYDLATGALRWTTFVVRGQVERNMFGRTVREFAAAPLMLARGAGVGESVLAQTGLGALAALDLATGALLWRATYEAIPLPKARSYHPPVRTRFWRMSPPVVAGSVVLATPADSADLLALDLTYGSTLWTAPLASFAGGKEGSAPHDLDHLIGASGDTLYFGGTRLAAFAKPEGLRSKLLVPLWSTPAPPDASTRWARAQLAGDTVVVPGRTECAVLDRRSGEPLAPLPLPRAAGMLVTDEAVFALTRAGLRRLAR